jgi:hypothetical protein
MSLAAVGTVSAGGRTGLTMAVEVIVSGGARSINRTAFNQKQNLEAVTK